MTRAKKLLQKNLTLEGLQAVFAKNPLVNERKIDSHTIVRRSRDNYATRHGNAVFEYRIYLYGSILLSINETGNNSLGAQFYLELHSIDQSYKAQKSLLNWLLPKHVQLVTYKKRLYMRYSDKQDKVILFTASRGLYLESYILQTITINESHTLHPDTMPPHIAKKFGVVIENIPLYGVEIECLIDYDSRSSVHSELEALHKVDVGSDASIQLENDGQAGIEVRIGPLTLEAMQTTLLEVTGILAQYGGAVNKSCGLHVHISRRELYEPKTIGKLALFWLAIEDVLLSTQPASRYDNEYCRRFSKLFFRENINDVAKYKDRLRDKLSSLNRYHTLNLSSIARHKTIEVRMHSGSVDAQKIINWLLVVNGVIEYVINEYSLDTVVGLLKQTIDDAKIAQVFALLPIPQDLRDWYTNTRIRKFRFAWLADKQRAIASVYDMLEKYNKAQARYIKQRNQYDTINREYESLTSAI